MIEKTLWVEKYRPASVDDYVFKDTEQKLKVQRWINDKEIPHCLFSGSPGVGKTTLAKLLINEIGIHEYDVLEINASRTNSIDDIRDTIVKFVELMPFGEKRVVFLDEADYLSVNAQAALRGLLEEYHITSRFILTANYPNRIIPAIHSRCQGFHIEKLDKVEYSIRAATILATEGIEFELDTLDTYVKATYPDLRKCINLLQYNTVNNQLLIPDTGDSTTADYKIEMVELFKEGKIREARLLLCEKARPEDMEDIFKWIYTNLDILTDNIDIQEKIILEVKRGLVEHTMISDPEINLSATLIRIAAALK